MRHVIVSRFSVPRAHDPTNCYSHSDGRWLERRFELFRRIFVPSVGRLEIPVILLCSTQSAPRVADAVADLEWVTVEIQDEWNGGWVGDDDQVVTRMDSDDAIHSGWIHAVETAPADTEVCCTREFLRYDLGSKRLCRYRRRKPSPLAAFRGGRNPFAFDHTALARHYRVHDIPGPFLLQVFHGGNVSSRRPSWYRRRLPLALLANFGLGPQTGTG